MVRSLGPLGYWFDTSLHPGRHSHFWKWPRFGNQSSTQWRQRVLEDNSEQNFTSVLCKSLSLHREQKSLGQLQIPAVPLVSDCYLFLWPTLCCAEAHQGKKTQGRVRTETQHVTICSHVLHFTSVFKAAIDQTPQESVNKIDWFLRTVGETKKIIRMWLFFTILPRLTLNYIWNEQPDVS